MLTKLYQIDGPWPGRLAIAPRPRGGDWLEDEVRAWRRAGVDIVVSLLVPEEIDALELQSEAAVCRSNGIEYVSLPIPDRGLPPSAEAFSSIVARLGRQLAEGKSVAVHCRQGIGRAGLVAISLLIAAGVEPAAATERVSRARGCTVPETSEQKNWLLNYPSSAEVPV